MGKARPDWEKAKALYRIGKLSNREIAAEIGVSEGAIRKKIKTEGWERDLAPLVQQAIREEMVRTDAAEVRTAYQQPAPASDAEIIEAAAKGAVEVIRQHRWSVRRAAQVCARLFELLEQAVMERSELEAEADEMAREGGAQGYSQRRNALLKALSLPTHAGTIRDLVTAMRGLQEMERVAWGIQKDIAPATDYETELKRLAQQEGPPA